MKDYIQFGLIIINIIFTVAIAFKQSIISKENLKLNLYDKRYRIYESTIEFIGEYLRSILSKNDDKMLDLLVDFKIEIHQSIFLYDDSVSEYLLKILNTSENIRNSIIREKEYLDDLGWLEKQQVDARKYFKPFMKFKK